MEFTIDYCTECGHLGKAIEAAEEILEEFEDEFDEAELVPSDSGVLRISVESQVVFDLEEDSFSRDKVRERVEEYIEEQEE